MVSLPRNSLSVGIFYRDLFQPGGMPRETALLARELRKFVGRVVLYCYVAESSREGEHVIEGGVQVRAFHQHGWRRHKDPLWAPANLRSVLRRNEDDISVLLLIGSFLPENMPVARLARRSGIPYVVSVADAFNPFLLSGVKGMKKRVYERLFVRDLVRGAVAVRLYSEAQVPELTSRGYVDNGRFFIVKEGIDWDKIHQEGGVAPPFTDTPPDPPQFGFLGRLDIYTKGLDVLLEAWKAYKQEGGRGSLSLAGPLSRRDEHRLARLRRRLYLPDLRVLPPIYGRAKYDFLRSLSFLVHPSRHEGIPRVVREALAMGCPVVVTEHTNLHDIVLQHRAGAVVKMDPHDLARTLTSLERSREEWGGCREGARAAARSLGWDDVARDMADALAARLTPM